MERDVSLRAVGLRLSISIHALRMERDHNRTLTDKIRALISIHALRMERDERYFRGTGRSGGFQSTRSAWSATARQNHGAAGDYISIHALRMERDPDEERAEQYDAISIHALRMERD